MIPGLLDGMPSVNRFARKWLDKGRAGCFAEREHLEALSRATLSLPVAGCVGFVLKGYPRLSETFIAQEIFALEQRGLKF